MHTHTHTHMMSFIYILAVRPVLWTGIMTYALYAMSMHITPPPFLMPTSLWAIEHYVQSGPVILESVEFRSTMINISVASIVQKRSYIADV